MTLDDFRVAFEKGRKDQYEPKPNDVTYPPTVYIKLSAAEAEDKIRTMITPQTDVLENVRKWVLVYGERERDGYDVDEDEERSVNEINSMKLRCFQAFKSFDPDYTGQIAATNFRSILDQFCFKLTDVQFKHIANQYGTQGRGIIEYTNFIDSFQDPDPEVSLNWQYGLIHNVYIST